MTTLDLGELEGRILLFGGPYSNLQATFALRQCAQEMGIPSHNVICNGDVVAYCGQPEETVREMRQWGVHTVMGNCEESVGQQQDDCGCGFEENTVCSLLSVEWYRFVSDAVSTDTRQWMRALPRRIRFRSAGLQFAVIHGGVNNMSEFVFPSSDRTKKNTDAAAEQADCIIGGHSGIPFGEQIGDRYWLNTGVIGMPANDNTTDTWYLLLDPGKDMDGNPTINASWHRLAYDHTAAAEAMTNAGLGPAYREALLCGQWPSMDVLPESERSTQGIALTPAQLQIKPTPKRPLIQNELDGQGDYAKQASTAL